MCFLGFAGTEADHGCRLRTELVLRPEVVAAHCAPMKVLRPRGLLLGVQVLSIASALVHA